MAELTKIFGDEKFITSSDGHIESVLISFSDYKKILSLYEDRALAQAMEENGDDEVYNKQDALILLEADED
jgi:hypothetical protein